MILQTARQQRNYNYLELIKMYNAALKKFGYDNTIKKADLYYLVSGLKGYETSDKIISALTEDDDEDTDTLELFENIENGKYAFAKEHKIFPVASKEETEIVYSMLQNGDFDLFLKDSIKDKLDDNIEAYFENINEKPFNLYDYIEIKGTSLCADNLAEIANTFNAISRAILFKHMVKIKYCINESTFEFVIQPIEFVYSQLDLRMRIKAFVEDSSVKTFYLSFIKDLSTISENFPFEPYKSEQINYKELVFSFSNIHTLPERVAARFSDYKKEIHYDKQSNTIKYHVLYLDNPTENNRIINRLLSLGDKISIETAEKDIVKSEAIKALEQYAI